MLGISTRMSLGSHSNKLQRSCLVRLQTHPHCGVEDPVRPKIHRPVTEGYCVVATRGGELPEVKCQSVTKLMRRQRQRELNKQIDGMRLSGQCEIRAAAQASHKRVLARARKASGTASVRQRNSESEERPRCHQSVNGDRMAGSVSELSRETHRDQTVFMARGPKSRPMGVRAFIVAKKRLTRAEPRNAGRWNRKNP
jgi:hypothetical protein